MSDSFWAIFGCGVFVGILMTLIIAVMTRSENDAEGHYIRCDMRNYFSDRDRNRSISERNNQQINEKGER